MDTKETIKKQFIGQKLYCKFIRRKKVKKDSSPLFYECYMR